MSRPRFLADEDLRFEIVLAVRRLEPAVDISTVVEIGRAGLSDADVLQFAQANGLRFLSFWIVAGKSLDFTCLRANPSADPLFRNRP